MRLDLRADVAFLSGENSVIRLLTPRLKRSYWLFKVTVSILFKLLTIEIGVYVSDIYTIVRLIVSELTYITDYDEFTACFRSFEATFYSTVSSLAI